MNIVIFQYIIIAFNIWMICIDFFGIEFLRALTKWQRAKLLILAFCPLTSVIITICILWTR